MANKGKPFSDDVDYPRITFQAPGRIFDRLLKERSLSDLKETVRMKFDLGSGSVIQFTQLRNGQLVDLEDEDDFDAFRAVAYEQRHANILVVLTENSVVDAKSSTSPLPLMWADALERSNANSLTNEDGVEVNLETLTTEVSPTPLTLSVTVRQHLPAMPTRKTELTRIETLEQRPVVGPSISTPSTSTSSVSASTSSISASATPPPISKFDVRKLFQTPSSQQTRSQHPPPSTQSSYTPFVPNPRPQQPHQQQNNGPGSGPPPRSAYPRQLNGSGPHSQPGPNASTSQIPPAMSSPRLGAHHSAMPPPPPPMSAQMQPQVPWPGYYYGAEHQHQHYMQTYPGYWQPQMSPAMQHFQNSSSQPSNSSISTETSSHATLPSSLPSQTVDNQRSQHPPPTQSSYTPDTRLQQPQQQQHTVIPLPVTETRWDRRSSSNNDPDSLEIVDTNVKALLNKLTMEEFDSISDQIIQWVNRSEKQEDGRTLSQVVRLVYKKAIDDATWSEIYARLCRKMMEKISPKVQDEGIRNSEGNPIAGGQLFRKYLLNICQEDFERGWFAKEATAEAGEMALYSDEYYAAQKAKRQGLGLIKFLGELFKVQMLTERIMHECIKKFLGNVQNPEEEEIESLCMLLTTVGSLLDNQKARAHLDIYFQRMQELSKHVSPQMQLILQDLIKLRDRKWQARNTVAAPSTLAQVHEAAAKEKVDREKEATQQRISMSRGGSRRGGTRGDYPQAGGWNSVSRATARASDLSQFGRFSKALPTTLGPSSVFAGKKDLKHESTSRTASNSNMLSALQEAQQESNKASEQPTKLEEEPLVSTFFSIRNLVTFFKPST